MEKVSFLFVVLSVMIAETETSLYLVHINPFLFFLYVILKNNRRENVHLRR